MNFSATLKTIFISLSVLSSLSCNLVRAQDVDFERAMSVMQDGYTNSDRTKMERAIAMLESAANRGSGAAAFNLGALYFLENSPFYNKSKSCPWTLKAASLNFVDAYNGAASCEMQLNRAGDKVQTMERYAMPWIRKVANEDRNPKYRTDAQELINQWEQAKADAEKSSSAGGTVRLGSLFSALGIDTYSKPKSSATVISKESAFVCNVYCRSASGPITRYEIVAKDRRSAASHVSDNANEICRNANLDHASTKKFSESQCSLKQ